MSSVSVRRRAAKSGARFQVRYRLGGRGYPVVHGGSFRTLKEARLRRDLIAGELAVGRNPAEVLRAMVERAPRRTFAQVAHAYSTSRIDLAASTRVLLANHLKAILPSFGERDPSTITVADVQEWVSSLRLKPSSVRSYLSTLRAVLDHAGLEPNPARDDRLRLPRVAYETVEPPMRSRSRRSSTTQHRAGACLCERSSRPACVWGSSLRSSGATSTLPSRASACVRARRRLPAAGSPCRCG